MLTRLKVSGFKNLVDVDVRFGPFTCIAGPNGVGKSNLFDAIRFLSDLADHPLVEAALAVRGDENGRRLSDIRSLFWQCGEQRESVISFDAEMIVPATGQDDLGEKAEATTTFLQYSLVLAYRKHDSLASQGSIEIQKEQLTYIKKGDACERLGFNPKPSWRDSAVQGRRSGKDYISTEKGAEGQVIKLHQDGRQGRALSRLARNLPRTVLSATNAAESPTALLARREMRSWRLLQLEPSALRRPDEFSAPTKLGANGSHLAATLYRLAHQNGNTGKDAENPGVYARVANRLLELIENVRTISIDRDETRELLTVNVTGADRTAHAARSLSDGTLRFLALAVLEQDPEVQGVLCLEEPENGIHPARIPAMIRLLQDIATDTDESVGPDNPLRQVIVNTHSPAVFLQVPPDSVLMALPAEILHSGVRFGGVRFFCVPDTWRAESSDSYTCAKGDFLPYLNPVVPDDATSATDAEPDQKRSRDRRGPRQRRVVDLLQTWFPGFQPESSDRDD